MALEFALRPRLDLERLAPPRRPRREWLPPLALPIVAYWLAIGGATYALLRVATEGSAESTELTVTPHVDDLIEAPPSLPALPPSPASTAESAVTSALTEPDSSRVVAPSAPEFEPPPMTAMADSNPNIERAPEPRKSEPAPVALRARASRAEPPPRIVRAVPREPELPAISVIEEPAPRPNEVPRAFVKEEPARDEAPLPGLPSCESAAASADETIAIGSARGAPDLTRNAFASVLEHGAYLTRCGIPERTALEICAAVRDGKVVGVSVTSQPRSPAINACVRRAVAGLRFPRSPRLDVTRTRFE